MENAVVVKIEEINYCKAPLWNRSKASSENSKEIPFLQSSMCVQNGGLV